MSFYQAKQTIHSFMTGFPFYDPIFVFTGHKKVISENKNVKKILHIDKNKGRFIINHDPFDIIGIFYSEFSL